MRRRDARLSCLHDVPFFVAREKFRCCCFYDMCIRWCGVFFCPRSSYPCAVELLEICSCLIDAIHAALDRMSPPLKVIASNEESKNHWQQKDYKGFNSSTDWDTADFSKVNFHVLSLTLQGQRVWTATSRVAVQRSYIYRSS